MTEFRWAEEADYQNLIEEANHAFDTKNYTGDFEKDTSKESFFPRVPDAQGVYCASGVGRL